MTIHRYAAKRDSNEDELFEVAEKSGAYIVIAGPLDGWCHHRGVWIPIEVKNPEGKNRYTHYQQVFLERCRQNKAPVWTWRTTEDVLRDLGAK